MDITTNEEEISSNIFGRLASIPLVDKYEAYQLLDSAWSVIASDLETIHRDGFLATKAVDPNMVLKKKGGTEEEVQEGWVGRIIPFDLVQKELLSVELATLKTYENSPIFSGNSGSSPVPLFLLIFCSFSDHLPAFTLLIRASRST